MKIWNYFDKWFHFFSNKIELKLFKSCFGNFLSFIFMWTLNFLFFIFLKRVCSKASLNFFKLGVNLGLVGPEVSLRSPGIGFIGNRTQDSRVKWLDPCRKVLDTEFWEWSAMYVCDVVGGIIGILNELKVS